MEKGRGKERKVWLESAEFEESEMGLQCAEANGQRVI